MAATTLIQPSLDSPKLTSKDTKKAKKKKAKKEAIEKPIRQAVGVLAIDTAQKKVLMLSSKKDETAWVMPRDECELEEHPEKAALRILQQKAGLQAKFLSKRIGCFSETNKKGRVVVHHWIYEVHNPTLLDEWPEASRKRVWMTQQEALEASGSKRIACLALQKME
ncbi:hypothetical protein BY458DRAFT_527719 [Sporodiniella umbellata]|nr:hypothetical protein BY458DRAFT_527719 [Sporodiniella umbellata]